MTHKRFYLFFSFTLLNLLSSAGYSDPVGETANFLLDRNPERTISMIKGGKLTQIIDDYVTNDEGYGFYKTLFNIELRISMAGNQKGQEVMSITEDYFTPAFWDELRENKLIVTPTFKIKHLGVEDTTTITGEEYLNCDHVLFYDIEPEGESYISNLVKQLSQLVLQENPDDQKVEDMELKSYVCDGLPALGASKMDMTGKTRGFRFKVGFDYAPAGQ